MSNKTLIDNLVLPPVSIDAGKEAMASLRERYKNIIQEQHLGAEESVKENHDLVMARIGTLRHDAEEQVYKTYQTRTDSRSPRLTRLLNELSSWLAFGTYFEYYYSDTTPVHGRTPIEDLGPLYLKVLEDTCSIPGSNLLFTVGHEKMHVIAINGDLYAVLAHFAAMVVTFITLKKKQAITQDSIRETLEEIIFKSTVFAESSTDILFYEACYFNPEEEIRDYLQAHHPDFDQEKYKYAYTNAAKWNKRFQYIQSQILHLNNQKIDTINMFSQLPDTTPLGIVCSVQEDIVISMGGNEKGLLSRLAMIAWLMRDGLVFNGEKRKISYQEMERFIKIQADNYIRCGMFIPNESYRK